MELESRSNDVKGGTHVDLASGEPLEDIHQKDHQRNEPATALLEWSKAKFVGVATYSFV